MQHMAIEKEESVLWLLIQHVMFRQDLYQTTTLQVYISYVKEQKTHLYTNPKRQALVANHLAVIDMVD
jgi:hypothetical protein